MFNTSNKSSSLVLKPSKSVQETSEEVLISLKLDSCSTDSYLSRFNKDQQILSIKVSIENYENQFFKFDFRPMLMYLCRVSFSQP